MVRALEGADPVRQRIINNARVNLRVYRNGGLKEEVLSDIGKIFDLAIRNLNPETSDPTQSLTAKIWVSHESQVSDEEITNGIDVHAIMQQQALETFTVRPQAPSKQISLIKELADELLRARLQEELLPTRFVIDLQAGPLSYGTFYAGAWRLQGQV